MNENSNTPLSVKDRIKELNEQNNKTTNGKMNFKDLRRKSSGSLHFKSNIANTNNKLSIKNMADLFEKTPDKDRKNNINKEKRKSVMSDNILNTLKFFEDNIKKNNDYKEEEMKRQKLYEQNRINMRERMRKLKEFILENKKKAKSNEEFFEQNKKFLEEEYKVKSYDELQNLINDYNKENPEEVERDQREKYKKHLVIDHSPTNNLYMIPEAKIYDNSKMKIDSGIINNYIKNTNNNFTKLEMCNKTNEFNFIPDTKEYINNKTKLYEKKNFNNEEILGTKKIKYNNESELVETSNVACITYEKVKHNSIVSLENYLQKGIEVEELRNRKIKKILGKLSEEDKSNYNKVEYIFTEIKNKNKDENQFVINNSFCLDCNSCFKKEEEGAHTDHYILQVENLSNNGVDIDDELNINDIDYNANLNKLYETLKKDQIKILKYGNNKFINFYGKILFSLYEIIINNNSIEDLIASILTIYDNFKKEIEPDNQCQYLKDYFLFYMKKIIKLAYYKEKKIEKILADLEEEEEDMDIQIEVKEKEQNNDINNNEQISKLGSYSSGNLSGIISPKISGNIDIKSNIDKYSEEDKKKYFLKLGLSMKFKYGKNCSISDLYTKAKEQNINPKDYEDFLMKELSD